jgi:putative restriction endonuclease
MTTLPLLTVQRSLLEKAASDNGFDLADAVHGNWLGRRSSHCALAVAVAAGLGGLYWLALSARHVGEALQREMGGLPPPADLAVPADVACWAIGQPDIQALHRALRRAFQLSRALPNALLQEFERAAVALPSTTEIERIVRQRVGQDLFRRGLMEFWDGRCAITGLDVPELLRASHVKPWAECESDAERLDVHNGLLLAPHLDALFDRGLMMVQPDGRVALSPSLSADAASRLGIQGPLRVAKLAGGHESFLAWHRERLFRGP